MQQKEEKIYIGENGMLSAENGNILVFAKWYEFKEKVILDSSGMN